MKSISCLFFLVLILALWPRRIVTADTIAEACAKTPYKELCESSLRGDSESEGADVHKLAALAVKLAHVNATDAQEQMKKLVGTTSVPFVQQCLGDCDATYDEAVVNLEESMDAFDSRGYNDIITWLAAAALDPQICEDYFKEIPGHTSPLTSQNAVLTQLLNNALALTKLAAAGKN